MSSGCTWLLFLSQWHWSLLRTLFCGSSRAWCGNMGELFKKKQQKVPQTLGVVSLIERNITSLGFNRLPEYFDSFSRIWQDWQEETFSCTLISFLVSHAAGASWLWSRGVHRSQHLHSTMVQQIWIQVRWTLFALRKRTFIYRWWLYWAAGSLILKTLLWFLHPCQDAFLHILVILFHRAAILCPQQVSASQLAKLAEWHRRLGTLSANLQYVPSSPTSATHPWCRKRKSTLHNICSKASPESK